MKKSAVFRVIELHVPLIILVVLVISFFTINSNCFAGTDFTAQGNISDESAYCVATAKINNDDHVDIVAALNEKKQIVWYENDGSGNFGEANNIVTGAEKVRFIYIADIDGDTDPDVLGALYGGEIWIYKNDGSGIFPQDGMSLIDNTDCNGAKGVFAADMDKDGDMDILSASFVSGKVAWYEQNDDGTFTKLDTFSLPGASCVIAADINLDGNIDIAASSKTGDSIVWYKNNGDKTFDPNAKLISNEAFGSTSLLALDIGGDERLDILSASGGSGDTTEVGYTDENNDFQTLDGTGAGKNIEWFKNTTDTTGSFNTKTIIAPDAQGINNIVISSDINGDPLPDLVYTDLSDDSIFFCIGKGKGIDPGADKPPYNPFKTPELVTDQVGSVRSIASEDFDGDGDMDLVSASYDTYTSPPEQGKIMWFKNVH